MVITNLDVDKVYNYLLDYYYFTEKELDLVIKAFGDNIDTYNSICKVRYGYDVEQMLENDEKTL